METAQRRCLYCQEELRGRRDKKYCDDHCRNSYNNRLKASDTQVVRKINRILTQNRSILKALLDNKADTAKVPQGRMIQLGFSFDYHTHIYTTKKGHTYYYCYEYGYLHLDNNWFLIVKNQS